jgi:hypothetical protein
MFTEEEFLAAMASFDKIIQDPIEYRLHYNHTGDITMCSSQNHPTSDQYLVVSKDIYTDYTKYRINVENKKLEKIVINLGMSVKLKKSDSGFAVVKNHAGLILEPNETYKTVEYYDTIN